MDSNALNNLAMQGVVTEVIGTRARVMFADRDNMVSAPLAVLQCFVGKNKANFMPSIDEEVVCLFLPTGLEAGYIIGSVYTDGNEPPADNNVVSFEDGGLIQYKEGKLIIKAELQIDGGISATGDIQTDAGVKAGSDVVAGTVSLKGHTNGGRGVDQ